MQVKQLDMFVEDGQRVDSRLEVVLFQKYAIIRKLGWQDFVAIKLLEKGDYTFDINKLEFEFMEREDLLRLGYTIILPDEKLYRDRIIPAIKFKASFKLEKYPTFYVEINL